MRQRVSAGVQIAFQPQDAAHGRVSTERHRARRIDRQVVVKKAAHRLRIVAVVNHGRAVTERAAVLDRERQSRAVEFHRMTARIKRAAVLDDELAELAFVGQRHFGKVGNAHGLPLPTAAPVERLSAGAENDGEAAADNAVVDDARTVDGDRARADAAEPRF